MLSTPNAASLALIRRGEVLLIKRAYAPYRALWTLPGGRTEPDESAKDCAIREIMEELGLQVMALQEVEVQDLKSASGDWRLAVFVSDAFEGDIQPSDEIAEYRWVALEEVRDLRTTSRLHDVLAKAFAMVPAQ